MSGRQRNNRPSGNRSGGMAGNRPDYRGSPWLPTGGGGFGASFADDYHSGSNFGAPVFNSVTSGYGGNAYGGASFKDPDVILKELGKCYLSSLSGNAAPVGNFAEPLPSYTPRYGNNSNIRGFVQRGYAKRPRESQSGNRDSRSSRTSSINSNQDKKRKLNNKPTPVTNGNAKAPTKANNKAKNSNSAQAKNSNSAQAKNSNSTQAKSSDTTPVKKSNPTPTKVDAKAPAQTTEKRGNKRGKWSKKKNNTVNSIVKSRYSQLSHNTHLDDNGRVVVAYLRQVLYPLIDKIHYSLTNSWASSHRNAIKIFQHEVKKALDEKFGADNANEETKKKKLDHLKEEKTKSLDEHKKVYPKTTDEEHAAREKVIDEAIDILTAEVFPEELVPTEEDYVIDPEADNSLLKMTHQFQQNFLHCVYESFGYTLAPNKASIEENIKFHLNNGFIPALLVECVTSDTLKIGDVLALPKVLAKQLNRKYIRGPIQRIKSENFNTAVYHKQKAKDECVETNILDFLRNSDKISAKVVRDLAKCILAFDDIATVAKFKLMNYTPYLQFSAEVKLGILKELVNAVYQEVLEVLLRGVPLAERTFVNLEGEAEAEDVKAETNGDVKSEDVAESEAMDTA